MIISSGELVNCLRDFGIPLQWDFSQRVYFLCLFFVFVLHFCFIFCVFYVFLFFLVLCTVSPFVLSSFLFLHKSIDRCHRVNTQLQ